MPLSLSSGPKLKSTSHGVNVDGPDCKKSRQPQRPASTGYYQREFQDDTQIVTKDVIQIKWPRPSLWANLPSMESPNPANPPTNRFNSILASTNPLSSSPYSLIEENVTHIPVWRLLQVLILLSGLLQTPYRTFATRH